MKKNKITEFILAISICLITFSSFFLPNVQLQKYVLTILFLIYTIIAVKFMKFNKIDNVNKKSFFLLILLLSIIHVLLLYFIGIWTGFYKNVNHFSFEILYKNILPYILIIICSEIIRQNFIIRKSKKNILMVTIALILAEVITYLTQYNFETLSGTLSLIGYILFPAISTNILCNYTTKRYGLLPNILYRIITIIYIYVFNVLPNIYMFFQSIYRIIYPYLIYIILNKFFEKNEFERINKNKKLNITLFSVCSILSILIVMLISCNFKYGLLVVGSSSMAGTIDKGDAIVFEQYKNQELEKGQIIVFIKDNIKTIHCIENIQIKNNETIYYTKGTNNPQQDEGYRTDSDIIGIVKFKIIVIGWPTIWFNNLFNN